MKYLKLPFLLTALLATVVFTACEKDDDNPENTPIPDNSEELITKVRLIFADQEDDNIVFSVDWEDADGPGENEPVIDDINLETGRTYNVSIELSDSSNPDEVEDITAEVQEEGDEHQFFFVKSGNVQEQLEISYADEDIHGRPIGLYTNWATDGITLNNAILTLILRHQPEKQLASVIQGNIEDAGGETDVQVDFNISIE